MAFRRWGRGSANTTPFLHFVSKTLYIHWRCRLSPESVVGSGTGARPVWSAWVVNMQAPFRTSGRAAKPVDAVEVRELGEADIALLETERGVKAPPLKRLGERHHALARCLASGMSPANAAISCGYAPSRVSILQADPAFRDLLAFYRADVNDKYLDMHGVLAGLSIDAAMELRERLEEDMAAEDKKMSVTALIELTKLGADRTGFGPQSSQLNVNVDLADRLQAARERVANRKIEGPDASGN